MSENILNFKSSKMVKPQKIKISQSRHSPVLETTVAENQINKKFLQFVLKDVEFQMELYKKARLPKEKLEQNMYAATFLIEYINVLLSEIDKNLLKDN